MRLNSIDEQIRRLERQAAEGDPSAPAALLAARARAGDVTARAQLQCLALQGDPEAHRRCSYEHGAPPFALVFQPNWNKQDTTQEYLERAIEDVQEGRSPGRVAAALIARQANMTPEEFDQLEFMPDDPWWLGPVSPRIVALVPGEGEGTFGGGTDSLHQLPEGVVPFGAEALPGARRGERRGWTPAERQEWLAWAYPIAIALTDGQRVVFVDPQGYRYARYAFFRPEDVLPALEQYGARVAPEPPNRAPEFGDVVEHDRTFWRVADVTRRMFRSVYGAPIDENLQLSLRPLLPGPAPGGGRTLATFGIRPEARQAANYPARGSVVPGIGDQPFYPGAQAAAVTAPAALPAVAAAGLTGPVAALPALATGAPKVPPKGPPGKPIRMGTKRSKRIFERAIGALSYSLDNQFSGQPVGLDYVRNKLEAHAREMGVKSMRPDGGGRYTIRYHSNHWIEVLSDAEEQPTPQAIATFASPAGNPPQPGHRGAVDYWGGQAAVPWQGRRRAPNNPPQELIDADLVTRWARGEDVPLPGYLEPAEGVDRTFWAGEYLASIPGLTEDSAGDAVSAIRAKLSLSEWLEGPGSPFDENPRAGGRRSFNPRRPAPAALDKAVRAFQLWLGAGGGYVGPREYERLTSRAQREAEKIAVFTGLSFASAQDQLAREASRRGALRPAPARDY